MGGHGHVLRGGPQLGPAPAAAVARVRADGQRDEPARAGPGHVRADALVRSHHLAGARAAAPGQHQPAGAVDAADAAAAAAGGLRPVRPGPPHQRQRAAAAADHRGLPQAAAARRDRRGLRVHRDRGHHLDVTARPGTRGQRGQAGPGRRGPHRAAGRHHGDGRRRRRGLRARPGADERLLERGGGDRAGHARRVAAHRRRGQARRRRLPLHRGPDQGRDHPGRVQRVSARRRGRPGAAPRRAGRGRGRPPGREVRRGGCRLRAAARRRHGHARGSGRVQPGSTCPR